MLGTVFAQSVAAAPRQQPDEGNRGNLAAMLDSLKRTPVPPQYRTNRSPEVRTVLKRAGRFKQLGLTDAEGKTLVDAVYRKLGLPLTRSVPVATQSQTEPLPFEGNYRVGQEFENLSAVLLRWPQNWSALHNEYAQMIGAIGRGGATARVWVDTPAQQRFATRYLQANGVPTSHIAWVVENTDSVWMRDYGPQYIYDQGGTGWGVADFHYYDSRPVDDDTPVYIADTSTVPRVNRQSEEVVYTEGGNINVDGLGFATYSERTYSRNPGVPTDVIDARIVSALRATSTLVLEDPSLDATGHVDMFTKILNTDTVLVAQYDSDEVDYQILEDAATAFGNATNGAGRPWKVVRVRQPDVYYTSFVLPVVRTYTNSLIVNNVVIVPTYGIPDDEGALKLYRGIFPDKEIVPINAEDIIESAGSWHCVTMEFPDPENVD